MATTSALDSEDNTPVMYFEREEEFPDAGKQSMMDMVNHRVPDAEIEQYVQTAPQGGSKAARNRSTLWYNRFQEYRSEYLAKR